MKCELITMKLPCCIALQLLVVWMCVTVLFVLHANTRNYRSIPTTESIASRHLNFYHPDSATKEPDNGNSMFTLSCKNIHEIELIKTNVGGGRSKCVHIGLYQGQKVVIKRLAKYKHPAIDKNYRQLLFLKEILLSHQLSHSNLIKLLGFCVRSIENESYKVFPQNGDISAVYEFGEEFNITKLPLSIEDRLRHALELASLLLYFNYSPLGSLIIGDFHPHHFLIVNNSIKLIDLDYVHNIEYPCAIEKQTCGLNNTCLKRDNMDLDTIMNCTDTKHCQTGVCKGYNDRYNIKKIYKEFLEFLLQPKYFGGTIKKYLINLHSDIQNHRIDSKQLENTLRYLNTYYKLNDDNKL